MTTVSAPIPAPAMTSGRHLITNGIRLHFLDLESSRPEHGSDPDGQTVVLIPGIVNPAITWEFVGRHLAAFGRVIVLDNRGRGLSSGGPDIGYTLDDYAQDAAGLIEALGLDRPFVLGHSMGGRIAIKLAATRPDLVGSLIVADPPLSGPGRPAIGGSIQWWLDGIDAAARGEAPDSAAPNLRNWTPEQLALRSEWMPTCDKTAVRKSFEYFATEDIHILLPDIQCRTLLIYAENGGMVTEDSAAEVASHLKDGRVLRIDNVGHMIPWDDLDGFVTAVRDFIADKN